MNINEIKTAAELKNWEIDITINSGEFESSWVGIHKGREVWHWFRCYGDNENFFFDHSYNRNTGVSRKGRGTQVKTSIFNACYDSGFYDKLEG